MKNYFRILFLLLLSMAACIASFYNLWFENIVRKRLLFLLCICVFANFKAFAEKIENVEIDGLVYTLINPAGNAEVTKSRIYEGSVVIPETITYEGVDYSVISIGNRAFNNCYYYNDDGTNGPYRNLTSVTFPNTIKTIGIYAFQGCIGLTSISIPNNVTTLGGGAFQGCRGLTSVTIGNSVTSINNYTFSGCWALTSVNIPSSVTKIGDYAFEKCSLSDITIPNSVIEIGSYAFAECRLTSITIPNSVTTIGVSAFSRCSGLTSVTIGNGVKHIGYDAFDICDELTSVHICDLTAWFNITFEPLSGVSHSQPLIYAHHLYLNGQEITDVVIPNSVSSINNYVLYGCHGLTSVTIPNNVTSIGEGAFGWCNGLTSIIIPNSVTSIGDEAFESCNGLTSIVIPNNVTSIGKHVFRSCDNLTSVILGNGIKSIKDGSFYKCSSLTSVTIPNSVTSIGTSAFAECEELSNVYCYAETVPTTKSDAFKNSYIEYATLHVPAASLESYRTTSPWSGFGTIVAADIPATSVSLNPTTLSFNAVNQTATLTATVMPSSATNKNVTWTSSNTSVATVNSTGVVTSKGNGTATITATTTDGTNLSSTCEVTVSLPVLATGISLNRTSLSFFRPNETETLVATIEPSNAANKNVTWTSSNTSVATVSSTGVVTPIFNGTAIITATTTDGTNLSATCNVFVLIGYDITISDVGYATFFDSQYDWILSGGLSARVVTGVSNNKLTYETIADGNYGEIVPKGTAVMLVGSPGIYYMRASDSSPSYTGTNLLHGSDEATMTTGDGYHYKLSYGKTGTTWDNIFGWYWGAQDGAPFQIEGHKAWLVVPASASIRAYGYSLDDDDATGITDMEFSDENHDIYYDIQGRRISTPANRGIYIKNGKKVVIK